MNKYINAEMLVNSKEFVREPIDSICKNFEDSSSKKIILCGGMDTGRGSGKSVILHNLEKRGIGKNQQCIYISFDLGFIHNLDSIYTKEFFEHYYEVIVTKKILNYINKYYEFTYENEFKLFDKKINFWIKEINNYINTARYYENMRLSRYLKSGEISGIILTKLKKSLNIDLLSLSIDRFDWINGSSQLSQTILSKYFDMFDKIIITSDDKNVKLDNRNNKYIRQGYEIHQTFIGKNPTIVKEIIRRRIKQFTNNKNTGFNPNLLTDNIFQIMLHKANGNIDVILDSVSDFIDVWYFKEGNLDLEYQINDCMDKNIDTVKKLQKMSKSPKLYL